MGVILKQKMYTDFFFNVEYWFYVLLESKLPATFCFEKCSTSAMAE